MAQIATITVETAGGPVDLPVYEPGDSGSGRLEAFRVQTASGPGFVPLAAVDEADRPYLRVQTSSGVRAVDTSASGIPDSGLKQRYRASDLSLNYGDTVSTWSDLSGNGNNASATGDPTLVDASAGDAVRLDGNDYFTIPNITEDNDFSIFVVLNVTDTTKDNYIYGGGYRNNNSHLLLTNPDNEYTFATYDDAFDPSSSTATASGSAELLDIVRNADSTFRMHLDGSQIIDTTTSAISPATYDHHIGWARPRDKSGSELVGDVYEIIKYDDDVTDSERQSIYNYVESEYGLTIA